jgi:fibronectin type 3 domain-containing protein
VRRSVKQLFTALMIVGCLRSGLAQGLQGKVTVSGSAIIVTGHAVTLTWTGSTQATSYNLYRGTVSGGPYVQVASGIAITTYTDTQVGHGQTLYYVATTVNGGNESGYSAQAVAAIP